jgi:hypothetical protein
VPRIPVLGVKEIDAVPEYVFMIPLDSESLAGMHSSQPLLQLFNYFFLHGWFALHNRSTLSSSIANQISSIWKIRPAFCVRTQ